MGGAVYARKLLTIFSIRWTQNLRFEGVFDKMWKIQKVGPKIHPTHFFEGCRKWGKVKKETRELCTHTRELAGALSIGTAFLQIGRVVFEKINIEK